MSTSLPFPTSMPTTTPTTTPKPVETRLPAAAAVPTVDPVLIERGYEVYRSMYCTACHALSAIGAGSTLAPSHDGMGSTAAERIRTDFYGGNATTAAEYIRESIVEPAIYIVDGYALSSHRMPAFSYLSDEDVEALVQMLLQQ